MGKWTLPIPIKIWYSASPDWHTPNADNDIIEHGRFNFRMEAKDESMGFNYEGAYTGVVTNKHMLIPWTMTERSRSLLLKWKMEF